MATTKKGTEPALPGSGFPAELDRTLQANETPTSTSTEAQEAAQDPLPAQHRVQPPAAPRGLVGYESRDAVARITLVLQSGEVQGRAHPLTGWDAAARALQTLSTSTLHPSVASYKAEAMEYLRGQHERQVGLKEQQDAKAVASSKINQPQE